MWGVYALLVITHVLGAITAWVVVGALGLTGFVAIAIAVLLTAGMFYISWYLGEVL